MCCSSFQIGQKYAEVSPHKKMQLKLSGSVGPVTALAVYKNKIIAGMYNLKSNLTLQCWNGHYINCPLP